MTKRNKVAMVVALVAIISGLHYATHISLHHRHIIYRDLYFLPVVLAGFWFGVKGAVLTSLSVTVLYLPFTVIHWSGFSPEDFNNVLVIILLNIIAYMLGLLRDRGEAQHKSMLEAQHLAAMGQACSAMAHDMKTPLVSIGGFSRQVHTKLEKDDPNREKLAIVLKEIERLENMVKDILHFSRPLDLCKSEQDINRAMEHSLSLLSDEAGERNVRVEWNPAEDLPLVNIDSMRMEQAFINLLMNAIQASPEDEAVGVTTGRQGDYIVAEISDNGRGMSAGEKEKMFVPFFTTKKEGTGLGLCIAKKIVESHGGTLEAVDNSERGMTFRILLPLGG